MRNHVSKEQLLISVIFTHATSRWCTAVEQHRYSSSNKSSFAILFFFFSSFSRVRTEDFFFSYLSCFLFRVRMKVFHSCFFLISFFLLFYYFCIESVLKSSSLSFSFSLGLIFFPSILIYYFLCIEYVLNSSILLSPVLSLFLSITCQWKCDIYVHGNKPTERGFTQPALCDLLPPVYHTGLARRCLSYARLRYTSTANVP